MTWFSLGYFLWGVLHTYIHTTSDGTHELISHAGEWYRYSGGLGAASVYIVYLFFVFEKIKKKLMRGTAVDSAFLLYKKKLLLY